MPTYHYRCSQCGHEEEVFQRMTDNALTKCSKCGEESYERVISAEGGFVLKGSGFYSTDYCGSKSSSKGSESGGGCSTGSCPFAK
ncbi:MAG: FmdB family zinc ribbon protein [Chlorobaculum sp.]